MDTFAGPGLGLVGLGLDSQGQATRVYVRVMPIHTPTGVVSRVYSIRHIPQMGNLATLVVVMH